MTGGDNPPNPSPPPPSNGGELLLRLVQNRHQNYNNHNQNHHQQQPAPQQTPPPPYLPDPAISAVGPTIPINLNNPQNSQNPNFFLQNQQQQGYFRHSTSQSSTSTKTPSFFSAPHHHFHRQQHSTPTTTTTTTTQYGPIEVGSILINTNNSNFLGEENHEVGFGLRPNRINGLGPNRRIEQHGSPDQRRPGPPPGFLNKLGNQRKDFENATARYGPTEVGNLRRDSDAAAKRANGPTEVGFSSKLGNQMRDFDAFNNAAAKTSITAQYGPTEVGFSSKLGDLGRDFDVFNNVAAAKTGATTQYGPTKLGSSSKTKNHRREFEGFNNAAAGKTATITQYGPTEMGSFNNVAFEKERRFSSRDKNGDGSNFNGGVGLSGQIDHPGLPSGSSLKWGPGSALGSLGGGVDDNEVGQDDEIDDLSEQLVGSVLGEDPSDEKNVDGGKKKFHRDKDFRSDARGKWILSQRMRNSRRLIECRRDIDKLDFQFLAIYESLMPVEEEIAKQKQLLTLLEQLVCKEWPNAKLYLYGSCANSFGFPKSDIDVCLAIDDQDIDKSEMLLRLADILQSGNFQDVQALTRARVPIVKLMDPVTGISCDICINNVLAVVNTKLLRDYAEIDVRLRQLAYLVKHWAKSRGVNETYHGTLSSYAYVLMCIHFLQLRNPPILPCLQNMKSTFSVTVEDIECTFFDQVEKLRNFGARNKENISKLLWGFFSYWAYCHDYPNQVISVRSGCILSKHEKDWTRRVGNDRHLICIEDPFETSHDLGRVVDKHSIRVLREEFERAAEIMQYDPNPCVALFEPYIPR